MSTSTVLTPPTTLDYSLTGVNSTAAVEKGLAEAEWYQSPVPRETMRGLLQRRDGPAIRDTILWFALILGTGFLTYALWGSWWAILPYMRLQRSLRLDLRLPLARDRPRHRVQDRLDE